MDTRFMDWLHAALERAYTMENRSPLAEYRPRRKRAAGEPEAGAVESWFEGTRIPVQDPPNLITSTNWFKVKLAGYIERDAA